MVQKYGALVIVLELQKGYGKRDDLCKCGKHEKRRIRIA